MYRRKNTPVVGLVYAREITCGGWGNRRRKWKLGLTVGICSLMSLIGLAVVQANGLELWKGSPEFTAENLTLGDRAESGPEEVTVEGIIAEEITAKGIAAKEIIAEEITAEGIAVEGNEQLPDIDAEADSVTGIEVSAAGNVIVDEEQDSILIAIDPGHGGVDEGCSGDAAYEKDINLSIALQVRELLLESGYRVLLTREDDIEVSLEKRVQMAQAAGADAYISIHQNACENSEEVQGIETWCQKEDSLRLARLVQKYTVSSTGGNDRGTKEDGDLYVTRETSMPSCLIETGFLSNMMEEQSLVNEEYRQKLAKGIVKGIELFFHPRTMYLTFDDGPSADNTSAVLDILAEKNIKATFFVVGENVEKNPEIARRIVREGHTIGIHCNTHDYNVIYESVDSYLEDFEAARSIVYEVTGVDPVLFRFPGGSINSYNKNVYKEIIREMTDRGYIYFDWNASLEDAVKKSTPEQLIENARESTLGRKKIVMLAHDIVYNTTLCLDELIDQLPEYRMEALTEDVKPIRFRDK